MTEKERELLEDTFLDEQQLSEEDQDLLDTIYNRLDIFQQQNSPYHDEAMECRQILHMKDPEQDDPQTTEENGKQILQLQKLLQQKHQQQLKKLKKLKLMFTKYLIID